MRKTVAKALAWPGFLVLLLLVPCVVARGERFTPVQRPVPASLFGLHIHRAASSTPWPPVEFGSWSLIDAYVNWRDIQPSPGRWNFDFLDRYVSQANRHDVEILYPLAFTPRWASARPSESGPYGPGTAAEPLHGDDWLSFVKTVGKRYAGRINYFAVWDEPNERSYFSGSRGKLLELVCSASRALREIDPGSRMVSPGLVGPSSYDWLDAFLANGGAACTDVIGFHFYPPIGGPDKSAQRPESMIPAAKQVRKVMAKHGISSRPLWNTGVGYWNANSDGTPASMAGVDERWIRLDREQGAAWVARTFIVGWALGMERVFWYSWDHENMGLIEPGTHEVKPSGQAYQKTFDWLVGSTMTYCQNDRDPQWVCELRRGDRKAWLVWRSSGNARVTLPAKWQAQEVESLLGGSRKLLSPLQPVTIGEQPILVKSDTEPW